MEDAPTGAQTFPAPSWQPLGHVPSPLSEEFLLFLDNKEVYLVHIVPSWKLPEQRGTEGREGTYP